MAGPTHRSRHVLEGLVARARVRLRGLCFVTLALVGVACTTGPGGSGELDVVVHGVPIGTPANVHVTGPAGFSRALDASEVLTGLRSGTYTVTALQAGPYAAPQPSQTVTVAATGKAYADVIYVDVATPSHACVPYAPTRTGATVSASWSSANAVDVHAMQAPTDPGGGWIDVELSTAAPAEPWMTIRHAMDSVLYIASAGTGGSSNLHGRRHVFEASPSAPYTFSVYEDVAATPAQHPWPYELSWTFHGAMDCYEPNDGSSQSKRVPLDQTIEAYAIVGHAANTPAPADPDWYEFELTSPQGVLLELVMNPANVDMEARLHDPYGNLVDAVASTTGGIFTKDFGVLAAGTWEVEFRPFTDTKEANPYQGEPIPAHFTTPYQFRLATN